MCIKRIKIGLLILKAVSLILGNRKKLKKAKKTNRIVLDKIFYLNKKAKN